MAIDLADIVSEYGQYYIGDGNMNDLYKKLYKPNETDALFPRVMTTDKTSVRSSVSTMSRSGMQSWQKAWTTVGDLSFDPWTHDLFRVKINNEQVPDELYDSWLQFLVNINDKDRANWPFVRWWLEEHVIPLAQQEKELDAIYKGVYAAPTAGTAGTVAAMMNGIGKVFLNMIAASRTTATVMGSVPTDEEDFCSYVESFYSSAVPSHYRTRPMKLVMNKTLELRYKEGKRLKYNLHYQQASDLSNLFHFPNAMVVGVDSMIGKDRIWTTPEENKVRFINAGETAKNTFLIDKIDFVKLRAFSEWHEAYGFHIPELVYLTDQV